MKKIALLASAVAALAAAPVAAQSFNSTFEGAVPSGSPGAPNYVIVPTADGWTGGPNGIELQYGGVAGAPAATGGQVFVELDTTANSFMSRSLAYGTYDLSFLYSPRPGLPASTNIIQVSLDSAILGTFTAAGAGGTTWQTFNIGPFGVGQGGGTLTFRALGTSDSLGGYVDNITGAFSAAPEPATWALMIMGFGAVGGALRRRRVGGLATA